MSDEKKTSITLASLTSLSTPKTGITEEICQQLCKAIPEYPTYRSACQSLGLPTSTVSYWIRMANNPGTPPEQVERVQRIMQAQAACAKTAKATFDKLVLKGEAAAATAMLKYMNTHWKDREADDIDHILSGGAFKADDLKRLLKNPSPRLIAILRDTGWYSINEEGLGWLANPTPSVRDALEKNGLSVKGTVINTVAEESPPESTEE